MASIKALNDIILFRYPESPYGRRVAWFLLLRGVKYAECIQPRILPRPDFEALGIRHRRIPLVYFRGTMYCDSRLILRVLGEAFPISSSSSSSASQEASVKGQCYFSPTPSSSPQKALPRLISHYITDAGIFRATFGSNSADGPLFSPAMASFLRDRNDFMGASPDQPTWTRETQDRDRPYALAKMREAFALVEDTLLAEGQTWISGEDKPGMADLEAVWTLHWAVKILKSLPEGVIGKGQFPRTFAWIERWDSLVKSVEAKEAMAVNVSGEEAVKYILASAGGSADAQGDAVDPADPLGLQKGEEVEVWPVDSGMRHKDRGKLLRLTRDDLCIEVKSREGEGIRLAMPRWGFKVVKAGNGKLSAQI